MTLLSAAGGLSGGLDELCGPIPTVVNG
jgi:hypothetical protein